MTPVVVSKKNTHAMTNAKQLLNKLNMYNISKNRLLKEMKIISKG